MRTRLALLLSLVALASCAKNNASVRIQSVCAIPDSCAFAAGACDAEYIGQIAIDLALTTDLILFVQVDNLLDNNANGDIFRTNTNDAFVQEYEIEYVGLSGTFTAPVIGSASIPANGSSVITLNMLPPAAAAAAGAIVPAGTQLDMVAKVRLKGVYADTTAFETGVYEVRFRACNGTGCANVLIPTCTAPAVPAFCPNYGQTPTLGLCSG